MKIDYRLYLVTDRCLLPKNETLISAVEKALKSGVTFLQLREKNIATKDFYNLAIKIKELTTKYNVPFVINDRIDIALAVDADGVHIGQDDLALKIARKLLGKDKIIGVSAHSLEEAKLAEKDGATYVGVGAMYKTSTKNDAQSVSLETLGEIKKNLSIPVVAIGGINKNNAKEILHCNVDGLAVVSAILAGESIEDNTKNLLNISL